MGKSRIKSRCLSCFFILLLSCSVLLFGDDKGSFFSFGSCSVGIPVTGYLELINFGYKLDLPKPYDNISLNCSFLGFSGFYKGRKRGMVAGPVFSIKYAYEFKNQKGKHYIVHLSSHPGAYRNYRRPEGETQGCMGIICWGDTEYDNNIWETYFILLESGLIWEKGQNPSSFSYGVVFGCNYFRYHENFSDPYSPLQDEFNIFIGGKVDF